MIEAVQPCIQSCYYVFCVCFSYQQSREYITQSPLSSIEYTGIRLDSVYSVEHDRVGAEKSEYKPLQMNSNPIGEKELRFSVI